MAPKNYLNDAPASDHAVVIGIAKDVTSKGVVSGQDATMIYFPTPAGAKRVRTFLIRGKGDVAATTRHLEATLAAAAPNRPAIAISLDEMFLTQMYPFWAGAWISAMLGGLALLLTLSGMYGVLSYLVGQRTKEIGIRIALGATPGIVVRLVLTQSLRFAIWGVAVGLALAFGGSLVLRHLLTMINALDLVSYASGINPPWHYVRVRTCALALVGFLSPFPSPLLQWSQKKGKKRNIWFHMHPVFIIKKVVKIDTPTLSQA